MDIRMDIKPTIINTEKETRSFFWFLTFILTSISVWLVITEKPLQRPAILIPFVVLMTVHIVLHWMLRRFAQTPAWTIGYILIQTTIMVAVIFLTRHIGLTLGLTMALAGESIGVYGLSKKGVLACVFYLAISLGFFIWFSGIAQVGWWLLSIIPVLIFVVVYVELYSRQVKANARAQELLNELAEANQKLQEYAAQVEDLTIAAERQRVARELHDTLSQGLAGIILQLEAADANLSNSKLEKSKDIIRQAMESARTTLADARLVIDDLRSVQPRECQSAIREAASNFTRETGIPCITSLELPQSLSLPTTDAVIQVVNECLLNIKRHSRATQVEINGSSSKDELKISVTDNGTGFDPQSVSSNGHYGLMGMRERMEMLGGTLSISSEPAKGTTVEIRIPLS